MSDNHANYLVSNKNIKFGLYFEYQSHELRDISQKFASQIDSIRNQTLLIVKRWAHQMYEQTLNKER